MNESVFSGIASRSLATLMASGCSLLREMALFGGVTLRISPAVVRQPPGWKRVTTAPRLADSPPAPVTRGAS